MVVVVLALVSAARVPALPCWMKGDVVWAGGRGGLGWFVAHYYPPALVPALKTPVGLSTRANLPRELTIFNLLRGGEVSSVFELP